MTVIQFPRKFNQSGDQWDPWLSKRQVAALLKRSERWVNLMHEQGIPNRVGRGGRREYPHDAVLEWWAEYQASRTAS